MPTNQQNSPTKPGNVGCKTVLSLRDLHYAELSENSVDTSGVDLEIRQGDLVLIHLDRWQNPRGLASMLQGLSFPSSGELQFEEKSWKGSDHGKHFGMRSRIGRVFDGPAWINNLNVYENVTLRAKHHSFSNVLLDKQIDQWSKRLAVPRLTRERPAFVESSRLQRYQWLRAFLSGPSLVILERPMKSLGPKYLPSLVAGVNEIRKQSAAVLWFVGSDLEASQAFTGQCYHYRIQDGRLLTTEPKVGETKPSDRKPNKPNEASE